MTNSNSIFEKGLPNGFMFPRVDDNNPPSSNLPNPSNSVPNPLESPSSGTNNSINNSE